MTTIKRQRFYVSGFSTAAAIVAEFTSTAGRFSQRKLRLEGYSIVRGSTVASTTPATLRQGPSSAGPLSSHPIAIFTAPVSKVVTGLGIEDGYFAIHAGTTSNDGTVASLWGSWV